MRIALKAAWLALLLIVGTSLPAQAGDIAGWSNNGRDLYAKCASDSGTIAHACGEYLLGFMAAAQMALPANAQLICPPPEISFFQLEEAYIVWAKANPDLLGRSPGKSAAAALSAAFPCGHN
jgi:hypothetical protein